MSTTIHRFVFGWGALAFFMVLVAGAGALQRMLWDPPYESVGGQFRVIADLVAIGAAAVPYWAGLKRLAALFPPKTGEASLRSANAQD